MFNIGGISYLRRTIDHIYKNQVLFKNKKIDTGFVMLRKVVDALDQILQGDETLDE